MQWLDDLPIRRKLQLLTIPLAIFALVVTVLFINNQNKVASKLESQLVGLDLIEQLIPLVKLTPQHRGTTNAYLNGNSGIKNKVLTIRGNVNDTYAELLRNFKQHPAFFSELKRINTEWVNLSESAFDRDAKPVFQAHTKLINELLNLMVFIADEKSLVTAEKREQYHLLQISIQAIPPVTNQLGILRGFGSGVIASKNFNDDNLRRLSDLSRISSQAIEQINSSFKVIEELAPDSAAIIKEQVKQAVSKNQEYIKLTNSIIASKASPMASGDFFKQGTTSINSLFELEASSQSLLKDLLSASLSSIELARNIYILVAALLLVSIGWLATVVTKTIVNQIDSANRAINAIAAKDYDQAIHSSSNDELGTMANGLEAMRIELKQNIVEIETSLKENMRIRNALYGAGSAVLITSDNLEVVFCNEKCQDIFQGIDEGYDKDNNPDQWPQSLTAADVNQLLSGQHTANTNINGVDLQISYTPIVDSDGNKIARVYELIDRTEELKQHAEEERRLQTELEKAAINQRIRVALDRATTNVLVADSDHNIVFLNNSMTQLLNREAATLTHHCVNIPSAIDDLIGEKIWSISPKHEQFEQTMQTISKAQTNDWDIEGLHFQVTTAPVLSDNQEILGYVMEWSEKTDEVNAQREIASFVDAASAGDFSQSINTQGKNGFFKSLAEGLNQLQLVTRDAISDISLVASSISKGDLSNKITRDYEGMFGELKNDLNTSIDNLTDVVSHITEAAEGVSSGTREIEMGMRDLSGRSEEQASSIEETAASMTEMLETVKSNAHNTSICSELATQAEEKATEGGQVVNEAVSAMDSIRDASNKINEIITVIDEIAFQTNLLALNAAVEAARAGEQGRGFAVVASEVRNLAQRSANAAKEIKELISDSVDKVNAGAQLVTKSGDTLGEIMDAVQQVSSTMQDIANASKEQSLGIQQVNSAISQIDQGTQQNSALVEEATAAGEEMAARAEQMRSAVSFFKASTH